MKTEYQYIKFVEAPRLPVDRKTSVWSVMNIRHNDQIGIIQWDGGWRQYVFTAFPSTIWSSGCLKDVQEFIEALMAEWKR